jgi:hypothetical protein
MATVERGQGMMTKTILRKSCRTHYGSEIAERLSFRNESFYIMYYYMCATSCRGNRLDKQASCSSMQGRKVPVYFAKYIFMGRHQVNVAERRLLEHASFLGTRKGGHFLESKRA